MAFIRFCIPCLFAFSQLVLFIRGETLAECLRPWFRRHIWDPTKGEFPGEKVYFEPRAYIEHLPLCITTVKADEDTCDMGDLGPLRTIFQCINKKARGCVSKKVKEIQNTGATAILWSGIDGRARAEALSRAHADVMSFSSQTGIYADTQVTVLQTYFAFVKSERIPNKSEKMCINMACMWLILNSDPKHRDHGNTLHNWSSLSAYEVWEATENDGREAVARTGMRHALVLNNYFWNIEVPTTARLFEVTDYTGEESQTKENAELVIHLREYTVEIGTDEKTKSTIAPSAALDVDGGWVSYNLFGPLASLVHINVVFQDPSSHVQYPLFTCAGTTKPTDGHTAQVANLKDLVDAYNEGWANEDHPEEQITDKLNQNLEKLVNFIQWTKAIPFVRFNHRHGVYDQYFMSGGWVTSNAQQPTGEPYRRSSLFSISSHSAPYNKLLAVGISEDESDDDDREALAIANYHLNGPRNGERYNGYDPYDYRYRYRYHQYDSGYWNEVVLSIIVVIVCFGCVCVSCCCLGLVWYIGANKVFSFESCHKKRDCVTDNECI